MATTLPCINIATRGSALALWQANFVAQHLARFGYSSANHIFKTAGDRDQTTPLATMGGGKGIFVKELETALLKRDADIAVHSLKDMAASVTEPFALAAILKRHSPYDVIIFSQRLKDRVQGLPPTLDCEDLARLGSVSIGTGSVRRISILKDLPNAQCLPLRGNIDTRLRKLEDEGLDAIILAEAALERLDIKGQYLVYRLDPEWFVPCAAQGALAVEVLAERLGTWDLSAMACKSTTLCVNIERKVLELLGGSCHMPAGVWVTTTDDTITARLYLERDGQRYRKTISASLQGLHPENLAQQLAKLSG
jgi:hydroxymethylbilane synthase